MQIPVHAVRVYRQYSMQTCQGYCWTSGGSGITLQYLYSHLTPMKRFDDINFFLTYLLLKFTCFFAFTFRLYLADRHKESPELDVLDLVLEELWVCPVHVVLKDWLVVGDISHGGNHSLETIPSPLKVTAYVSVGHELCNAKMTSNLNFYWKIYNIYGKYSYLNWSHKFTHV